MNKYLAGAAIAVVALSATPAAAAAPQGVRVEALVGADILRTEQEGVFSPTVKVDDTGVLYGIGAGFDFAVSPSFSVGADVELSDSNAKLEKTFVDVDGDGGNVEINGTPKRDAYVGARLSYSVSDVSNVYIKGGYTNLRFATSARYYDIDGVTIESESDSGSLDGYRVGLGAQVGFMGMAYLGGEVRYSNYEDNVDRVGLVMTVGARF